MRRAGRLLGRVALIGLGAAGARAALAAIARSDAAAALERTNHRGRTVSLAEGPALAAAASLGAAVGAIVERRPGLAAASVVAGLGAGAMGLLDDVAGDRSWPAAKAGAKPAKGFKGHLGALAEGRVTTGLVKIAGVGAAGVVAGSLLPGRRLLDRALAAGVIAGTANLVNLLDLRPGRALKAGLILGAPLAGGPVGGAVAGPIGASAAMLPEDLGERTMLGDAGANALGALLGAALAARTGRAGRLALLAGLAGLTAASERVSFTRVIESTPGLRELDALGRKPRP